MSKLHAGQMLMNEKRLRILLIRFSSLGDLVLLTALVEGIGEAFPGHELHLATKEQYRELFASNRRIAKIHTLPERAGFGDLMRLRRKLASGKYDMIIDAHNVIRSNVLFRTLGARRKVQLGKDLDAVIPHVSTHLDPPPAAEAVADALFNESGLSGRTVVAIAPGARWETKRWPAEKFADVTGAIHDLKNAVLVIGDDSETEICRNVAYTDDSVNACGKLSLMETAAALRRASVLITNDSAPLHIAEAVGTPVVALFGPTVRQFGYFPLLGRSVVLEKELDCRPCSRNGAKPCHIESRKCLDLITCDEVLGAVKQVLESSGESK
jgi:heptosyltransferase-2